MVENHMLCTLNEGPKNWTALGVAKIPRNQFILKPLKWTSWAQNTLLMTNDVLWSLWGLISHSAKCLVSERRKAWKLRWYGNDLQGQISWRVKDAMPI